MFERSLGELLLATRGQSRLAAAIGVLEIREPPGRNPGAGLKI